jgi:hypothetical protein
MRQLIIEYLFEGHNRGYNFTSPTQGFNDDTLKFVWRAAMPRGQGWGADIYAGARSLKSFLMPDGRVALSETVVTGLRDENGRGGIRRAVVDVMQPGEYRDALRTRLGHYPPSIQAEAARKPGFGRRRIPAMKGDSQVICSHPYHNPESWQLIEALVLATVGDYLDKRWVGSKIVPFTSLALDYHEESQLVVLPEQRVQQLTNIHIIRIK